MKLERERAAAGPVITGFSAGGFRVGDAVFAAVLLTPEEARVWSPPPIEALAATDLVPMLEPAPPPEFLLLGTGATLVRPSPAFVAAIEALGVGVEAMDSRAAARAWGVLRSEGRRIVGALYPIE